MGSVGSRLGVLLREASPFACTSLPACATCRTPLGVESFPCLLLSVFQRTSALQRWVWVTVFSLWRVGTEVFVGCTGELENASMRKGTVA